MSKYRATLNMSGCRYGQVAEFDDNDQNVIRMVLEGHLLPVDVSDEATSKIAEARVTVAVPAPNSIDAVREALKAARERHGVVVPGEEPKAPEVTTEASEGLSGASESTSDEDDEAPEEAAEEVVESSDEESPSEDNTSNRPAKKSRSGNQRRNS